MSDDLISRKAAIAIIESKRLLCGRHNLSAAYMLGDVQEKIMNLPAAYDVDKVAGQIAEATRPGQPEYYLDGRPVIYKDQAIEIIRSGGRQQEKQGRAGKKVD